MFKQLKHFLFKKISPIGLGVFRIAYGLVFLFEIISIFNYRQLYFDKLPYLEPHFPNISILLVLWMFFIVFLIIGLYTRIITLINYIFTLVFISSALSFEYHMFYVYSGVNFLLIFLPVYSSLSFDVLRKRLKYIEKGFIYIPPKVSKFNYLLPVFIALGLVYFDSVIFFKIQSPMWLRGLGLWLPSSLPQITIAENQWLLNQELLVKLLSYITMTFEFMFIFLFWNKRYRLLMFIIGVSLHIGIFIEYPIPYFGLGCMTIFILMVPVSSWRILWNKFSVDKKSLTIYYTSSDLYSNRFKIVVEFLDIFNSIEFIDKYAVEKSNQIKLKIPEKEIFGVDESNETYSGKLLLKKITEVSILCFPLIFMDQLILFNNPLKFGNSLNCNFNKILPFIKEEDEGYMLRNIINNSLLILFFFLSILAQRQVHYSFFSSNSTTYRVNQFLIKGFGICKHPVFMDSHFAGYTNVYGLKYKNRFLPLLDENGMPDDYISGGTWVNYMWRVNMPYVKENAYSLRKGLRDYSSFWSHENDIDLSKNQQFDIVCKKIRSTFKWEKDLLKKNMESPWEKVGTLTWENKRVSFLWNSKNKSK